jgi:hypothetical protein
MIDVVGLSKIIGIKITIYGGERVPHRHILSSKALQLLSVNDSFVTDEEQFRAY